MDTNAYKTFSDNCEMMLTPLSKYNAAMSKSASDLIKLHVSALNAYSEIAISSLSALSEVKDLPSLAKFNSEQLEKTAKLSKQCNEDFKKLTEISTAFKCDVEKMATEATTKKKV